MIDGIILAGGAAKRMGRNKMMLPFNNQPIIYHTLSTMAQVCDAILIVTGFYKKDYLKGFNYNNSIKQVHNSQHQFGMFTSVQVGIQSVHNDCFIIPGDYPLVNSDTYRSLLQADGEIRVPVYKGRRGHPIFISKNLFPAILAEPQASNLKTFRDRHEVTYVVVDDPYILWDVDTNEEYLKLQNMERKNNDEHSSN